MFILLFGHSMLSIFHSTNLGYLKDAIKRWAKQPLLVLLDLYKHNPESVEIVSIATTKLTKEG